jgi:hypothetical protein
MTIPAACKSCPLYAVLIQINETAQSILSDTSLKKLNPSIQNNGLIDWFLNELSEEGLTTPYPISDYNEIQLNEKILYYKSVRGNINNRAGYLRKLISGLQPISIGDFVRVPVTDHADKIHETYQEQDDRKTEERHQYLDQFKNRLTDLMIQELIDQNKFLKIYCKTVPLVRSNPTYEYAILDLAEKKGLFG